MTAGEIENDITRALRAAGVDTSRPYVVKLKIVEGSEQSIHLIEVEYFDDRQVADEVVQTWRKNGHEVHVAQQLAGAAVDLRADATGDPK